MFLLVDAEGKYIRTREREEFREVGLAIKREREVRVVITSLESQASRIRADSFSISTTSSPTTLPRSVVHSVHGFRVHGSRYLGRHYTDCVPGSTRLADY